MMPVLKSNLKRENEVKLGILKTDAVRPDWASDFGEYPDMFIVLLAELEPDWEFKVYDVELGGYPNDIDEVDAYLITGSKSSVYDDKPWITQLLQFIRDLHARKKKLVGICFGHQAVAQALGGRVEKSAKGWGMGLHTHHFNKTPKWHDQGELDFSILVSHQDQVVEAPPGADVLASSDFCENAVSAIGEHILTFQGHPEFVPDYSKEIMQFRRELIGEQVYQQARASLATPPQRKRMAQWLVNFLANS